MAVSIRSISKMVESTGIKILVYGLAGAGKTVFCATAGAPTLILSAEAGLLSIAGAPKYVKGVVIKSIADLREILDWLKECSESDEENPFEWIALDSITEIAEQVLSYEKANSKDPRMAYMTMQDEITKLLRQYRDLSGFNVVMSCKLERIDDEGKKIYAPMMPGNKLAQQIPYLFDEVFALRVETDEDGNRYRIIQTNRDAKYEAKDRSGLLDDFEEPNLKKIAAKIRGEKPKPKVKEEKPKDEEATDEEVVEEEVVEEEVVETEEVEEAKEKSKPTIEDDQDENE